MKKGGSKGQPTLLLAEALARFCDVEMPARNLSLETRRGYTYDLSEWVATIPASLPVAGLSTDGIARYLSARSLPPDGGIEPLRRIGGKFVQLTVVRTRAVVGRRLGPNNSQKIGRCTNRKYLL